MTLETVLIITYTILLLATGVSLLVFLSSYTIWFRMVKSYANIKRLAPRLDEPEFQDDRNRMDESMANVASWIKDVRYFMLLQILLIGVSVYNLMYEDFVHPVICFIAVMAHIYLWKSNADSRRKLAATVGLNMAMTNLLIASDLYKMFNEDERIKDIKVQILDKEK